MLSSTKLPQKDYRPTIVEESAKSGHKITAHQTKFMRIQEIIQNYFIVVIFSSKNYLSL